MRYLSALTLLAALAVPLPAQQIVIGADPTPFALLAANLVLLSGAASLPEGSGDPVVIPEPPGLQAFSSLGIVDGRRQYDFGFGISATRIKAYGEQRIFLSESAEGPFASWVEEAGVESNPIALGASGRWVLTGDEGPEVTSAGVRLGAAAGWRWRSQDLALTVQAGLVLPLERIKVPSQVSPDQRSNLTFQTLVLHSFHFLVKAEWFTVIPPRPSSPE